MSNFYFFKIQSILYFVIPIPKAMRLNWKLFYIFYVLLPIGNLYADQKNFSINTVIIDPGHGGSDPGAINKTDKSLMEKNINLGIAKSLNKLIAEKLSSVKIVATRTGDYFVSLGERAKIANKYIDQKAIFISIHTNSHTHNRKVEGVEVFYHYASNSTIANFRLGEYSRLVLKDEDKSLKTTLGTLINTKAKEDSKSLAGYVANGIHMASTEPIRRVAPSNLYVVSYGVIPSILVEVGFISNDKLKNQKYLDRLAKGIFIGILGYIKEREKE